MSMLIITGKGQKNGELPAGYDKAREYFADLAGFIQKIEDVDTVKPLKRANSYLVTHKPIGAMNFYTTVVYCLEAEWTDAGVLLKPLDFDTAQIQSQHTVLKGMVNGMLKLDRLADARTGADLTFELAVELPIPGMLKLVPQGMIQTTADGIMTLKVGQAVEVMYRKVLEDFNMVGQV